MADCCAASTSKKKKTEDDDIFSRFHTEFLKDNPSFLEDLFGLNQEFYALCAYEIRSCNAADPEFGICFTKALCAIRARATKLAFGNFFIDAFKLLKKFVKESVIPDEASQKLMLVNLVRFLLDYKNMQEPMFELVWNCENETDLTVLLASHFFSQLSISPSFTIDISKSDKRKRCPCGKIHSSITYGDTSIGNPDVWYGRVDIIMEGAEVIIALDGEESSDVDSVIEVKQKNFQMNDLSVGSAISQVAAETIVYSFYHRKNHPGDKNSLIPCIGVCYKGLIFYFYDSVNDVLLGSTLIPFFYNDKPKELSIQTIIATWMVLNHKNLCNGLSSIKISDVPKAGFFDLCKDKLEIYKKYLKRGNVQMKHDYPSVDPAKFPGKLIVAKEFDLI